MVRGTTNLVVSTLVNMWLLAIIAMTEWSLEWLINRLWADGTTPGFLRIVLWAGTAMSACVVVVSTALDALKTLRNAWSETR